jgi:hypothetical protein
MTTKEFFETAEKLFGPRFLNPTLCTGFAYSGTDLTRLGDTLPNKEVLEQLSLRPNVHIVPAPPEAIGYRWDLFDLVDRLKLAVPGEVLTPEAPENPPAMSETGHAVPLFQSGKSRFLLR